MTPTTFNMISLRTGAVKQTGKPRSPTAKRPVAPRRSAGAIQCSTNSKPSSKPDVRMQALSYVSDAEVLERSISKDAQSGTCFPIPGGLRVEATKSMNYNYYFVNNLWNPINTQIADKYREYGRCLIIADQTVLNCESRHGEKYGDMINAYFEHHNLPVTVSGFTVTENEKTTRVLESMIDAMQDFGLNRQEPVLLMGGGLLCDIAGFACSQLRRNTPYCRVPTSLVALIDASIAIKVAVNHGDLKNKLGGYHAHDTVWLDTSFVSTLPAKEIRVGIAELIKIAVVEEKQVFDLLHDNVESLVDSKFGYVNPDNKYTSEQLARVQLVGQEIIEKGIFRMLELESPNLHELELDRAIAYGHTWGPVLELQNKYLTQHDGSGKSIMHGHGVGMDMALSATLAWRRGHIDEKERDQIIGVISRSGLMIDHPIHHDSKVMKLANDEIVHTRNGLLRAAVPTPIGTVTYINDLSHEELMETVEVHTSLCKEYPRAGLGIDYHVEAKVNKEERFIITPLDLAGVEMERAKKAKTYLQVNVAIDKALAVTGGVDDMVNKYSMQPSESLTAVMQSNNGSNPAWAGLFEKEETSRHMEMEMISGQAEAQFLKFLIFASRARTVLDVGTFTGYSALAMSEALPQDGKVVTIELEPAVARIATENFAKSPVGSKIDLRVGDANEVLAGLKGTSESFDLVFVDAHKPDYVGYYTQIVDGGLLKVGGCLVVDNTMYKGEELSGGDLSENGKGAAALNEILLNDARMHQVMLPLRDGVTVAYRMN